jgi:dihydrofolate reductase
MKNSGSSVSRNMRKLVVTENVALDGVIDATGGWFDPTDDAVDQSDLIEQTQRHSDAADAFLCGRNTFEAFRGFWPNQTDDQTGVTDYLNRVHKYVVSSTITDPEWENSTVLRGPLAEEITRLKEQPGRDIVATGSISLVHGLIAENLVDEYRLFVYPTVVGRGARLFEEGASVSDLELIDSRTFNSGVALLTYRVRTP